MNEESLTLFDVEPTEEQIKARGPEYYKYHMAKHRLKNKAKLKARHAKWLAENREYNSHRCKQWYIKNRARSMVRAARIRSKRDQIAFDLNGHVQDIQARIDTGHCELSGVAFDVSPRIGGTRVKHNAPSIDRIVPGKGYVYSNIRIIAFSLNLMFLNWGERSALEVARAWVAHEDAKGDHHCGDKQ